MPDSLSSAMALEFCLDFASAVLAFFLTVVNWDLLTEKGRAASAESTGEPMTPTPMAAATAAAGMATRALRDMVVSYGRGRCHPAQQGPAAILTAALSWNC